MCNRCQQTTTRVQLVKMLRNMTDYSNMYNTIPNCLKAKGWEPSWPIWICLRKYYSIIRSRISTSRATPRGVKATPSSKFEVQQLRHQLGTGQKVNLPRENSSQAWSQQQPPRRLLNCSYHRYERSLRSKLSCKGEKGVATAVSSFGFHRLVSRLRAKL